MTAPSPARFADLVAQAAHRLWAVSRAYVELHDAAYRGRSAGSLARISRGGGRSDPTAEAAARHASLRARLRRAERHLKRIVGDLERLQTRLEDPPHREAER